MLDQMQRQLDLEGTATPIEILSVNQVGLEQTAGGLVEQGYGIAVLQDSLDVNAWGLWQVNFRDFFVLDTDGRLVSITQLSPADEGGGGIVGDQEAYDGLMAALLAAAGGSP